ncbi:hypothetical protein L195_g049985, partial [Trifolium pratense]
RRQAPFIHLIRDSGKCIYKGVFHRTLDSGISTLSRVIRGGGGVGRLGVINLSNQVLPNTSIRGLASLSRDDDDCPFPESLSIDDDNEDDVDDVNYVDDDDYYIIDDEGMTDEERFQVTEADFQRGFKDYCIKRDITFSSEEEKLNKFKWFCKNYVYGRDYPRRRIGRRDYPHLKHVQLKF